MVRSQMCVYPARGREFLVGHSPLAATLRAIQDPIKLIEWVGLLALFMSVMTLLMTSE